MGKPISQNMELALKQSMARFAFRIYNIGPD